MHKGSITVDGISLTVSGAVTPHAPASPTSTTSPTDEQQASGPRSWFEVSLIPETLKRTTLGIKQPGDEVNLEVDVIAKYVEKLMAGGTR